MPKGRLGRAALVALGTLSVSPQVAGEGDAAGDGDVAGDDDGMTASGGVEGDPPYPRISPIYGLIVMPDFRIKMGWAVSCP